MSYGDHGEWMYPIIDALRKENAYLRQQLARYQWQPIDAMPESARDVLLWFPDPGMVDIALCLNFTPVPLTANKRTCGKPSHWMPSPEGPKEDGNA